MGLDKATRDVLRDIASYPALIKGDPNINIVRAAYDQVFAAWTATALKPTQERWVSRGSITSLDITPTSPAAPKGTIIFLHGGGWSLGNALCYAPLGRYLAGRADMKLIVPDFPQSPENPYPAAIDALGNWLIDLCAELRGAAFIAGDSAGGTLSALLCRTPALLGAFHGQGLLYPVMDLRADANYRSRRKFGRGKYFLTNDGIIGATKLYGVSKTEAATPQVSPILQTEFHGTPPTFFLLPEYDPLLSEGELYRQKLKTAGVKTQTYAAKKTIHGCASFSGRIAQGRIGLDQMVDFFHQQLAHR